MDGAAGAAVPAGLVGPNAVTQLLAALEARYGPEAAGLYFERIGLGRMAAQPPQDMIDETLAAMALNALWEAFPDLEAHEIARDAGHRTADYIAANRIPRLARTGLGLMPAGLSVRFLLTAIARHAWTFAGSGACRVQHGRRPLISIRANPLAMPDCAWHVAVFERLLRKLSAPEIRVNHEACCLNGSATCDFRLTFQKEGHVPV